MIYNERSEVLNGPRRILLASPVRQTPEVLKLFLTSIEGVMRASDPIHILLVDDNDDAASSALLQDFRSQHLSSTLLWKAEEKNRISYRCTETTHEWNEALVNRVAGMKNSVLNYAKSQNYKHLMLIDSDVLVPPNTIERLISTGKDVIANIFWTSWQPNTKPGPQVWLQDVYSFKNARITDEKVFLDQLEQPGVYEVGGLGACTLISNKSLHMGVSFTPLHNVSFWGEDRHFSIRAVALGLSLWVDTRGAGYHVYRASDIEGGQSFLLQHQDNVIDDDTPMGSGYLSDCVICWTRNCQVHSSEEQAAWLKERAPISLSTEARQEDTVSRFFRRSDTAIDAMMYAFPSSWWSRRYEYAWAASFAGKDQTVLDAACGILHPFKFHLNRTCRETFACDRDERILSPDMILNNIISEIGIEAITHEDGGVTHESFEGLKLAQADIAKLPYEDERFDRIFCISVLEHMDLTTMTSTLGELRRVLKRSGLVVLTFDFPTIDLDQMDAVIRSTGLSYAGSVDRHLLDDAVFSDLWGRLYCFRALLRRQDHV